MGYLLGLNRLLRDIFAAFGNMLDGVDGPISRLIHLALILRRKRHIRLLIWPNNRAPSQFLGPLLLLSLGSWLFTLVLIFLDQVLLLLSQFLDLFVKHALFVFEIS